MQRRTKDGSHLRNGGRIRKEGYKEGGIKEGWRNKKMKTKEGCKYQGKERRP